MPFHASGPMTRMDATGIILLYLGTTSPNHHVLCGAPSCLELAKSRTPPFSPDSKSVGVTSMPRPGPGPPVVLMQMQNSGEDRESSEITQEAAVSQPASLRLSAWRGGHRRAPPHPSLGRPNKSMIPRAWGRVIPWEVCRYTPSSLETSISSYAATSTVRRWQLQLFLPPSCMASGI